MCLSFNNITENKTWILLREECTNNREHQPSRPSPHGVDKNYGLEKKDEYLYHDFIELVLASHLVTQMSLGAGIRWTSPAEEW